ncbi:MAG: phosphoribosylaminoimidazole-succinocarboxamide synthase [Saprospiraceae bacterium]|jgi:phosphoribosylaminoimidazole-succinocarboxamide synthase
MNYQNRVLAVNDDLPIRTDQAVHSGKVRSVYWLSKQDSARLIQNRNYAVAPNSELALMVISDRLSAFDCIWHAEEGLNGVPGKGAALNAISNHWFALFKVHGLAPSHIVDIPHPFVWIVQRAKPLKIEAIARQYLTGSMWRAYELGEREFCGIHIPDKLQRDQKLPELLITPSTKGILKDIPGVPVADDVNISRQDLETNFAAFNFESSSDISQYEHLLKAGFSVIEQALESCGQTFVDTKFEFGYVGNSNGESELIYMDEIGTPDSSRLWDTEAYQRGEIVENSKEGFRQFLLKYVPDSDVLLNKQRMPERLQLAKGTTLPASALMEVSDTYLNIAETITGLRPNIPDDARKDIIDALNDFDLIV